MATQRQIEANRLNAQKSTGPKSDEGKQKSSMNALKSGLDAKSQFVLGETPEQFAELQAQWYSYLPPNNPDERYHLDQLIRHEWFQLRYFRVEAQLWDYHTKLAQQGTGMELGEAFHNSSTVSMRLHRRMAHSERGRKEARKELARLRQAAAPPPQPEETKAETPQLASFRTPAPEPPPSDPYMDNMPPELKRQLTELGLLDPDPGENE